MGMASALVVWLAMLAASQAPDSDVSYMNEREFQIPITLPADPAFQAEIDQLFLYVSSDEGKTWRQEAAASPRDKHFPFFARQDGSYWFNVSVQDKMKRSYPADITTATPALKVVVDTRKPSVKLSQAERQGDQVSITWDVRDEHLDLATCQLEYAMADGPTWYAVPIAPASPAGQKRWNVTGAGKVTVRMTVQDLAGNVGTATVEVAEESTSALSLVKGPTPPAAAARPTNPPVETPFPNTNWQKNPVEPPAPPRMEATGARPFEPPSRMPPAAAAAASSAGPVMPPVADEPMPRVIASSKVSVPPTWAPASSQISQASVPPSPAVPARTKPTGPPVQYINQMHMDLNYEAKAGPSGVGEVQLWVTQDDGRTWRRFVDDADLEPPFAVDLPGEGSFGFSLIIRSKGGIYKQNKAQPQPGEAPELRVEVDVTPPEAEMYAVEADPRRKDALFLTWKASDKNMMPKPVTLKWAEKPTGPWQEIAVEVANTGRYEWQMPANLPYRIFLRMEVRDMAGNMCVAETDQPVLVDLVEPEGSLTGIVGPPKK